MLASFLRGVFAGARVDFESPSKQGLTDVVAALAAHVKGTHDLESIARNSAKNCKNRNNVKGNASRPWGTSRAR